MSNNMNTKETLLAIRKRLSGYIEDADRRFRSLDFVLGNKNGLLAAIGLIDDEIKQLDAENKANESRNM